MRFRGLYLVLFLIMLSVVCPVGYSVNAETLTSGNITSITSDSFITRWDTSLAGASASNQILLPLQFSGSYNFMVDWGDGTTDTITVWDQSEVTHTYSIAGVYEVVINGFLNGWRFNNDGDRYKIIELKQWGNMSLGDSSRYFAGARNMVLSATDAPDLSDTTSLNQAFSDCRSLGSTGDMSNWDVSTITDMKLMFQGATSFNQPLDNWDVSSVTDMNRMFQGTSFNQPLDNWDVSLVLDMREMFGGVSSFNQPLGNWDVSLVSDMSGMFRGAASFNQSIGSWNVSQVLTMRSLFYNATSFNQPIGNWDTSSVTDLYGMFRYAIAFNQDLSLWDVSQVTDMTYLFANASTFNQPIGNWDVSNVTSMYSMFNGAISFDRSLSDWNISKVTDLNLMFNRVILSTPIYDQLLDGWSRLTLQNGVNFHGGDSYYTNETARQYIIDTFGWIISDGGVLAHNNPDVSSPIDFEYEYETQGNEINWEVGDINPWMYNVTRNGNLLVGLTSWTNGTLTLNVDELDEGLHVFVIHLYDTQWNEAIDSVVVTVYYEFIPPIVNSPDDLTYKYGSTGNSISWTVGDIHPGFYNITNNDELWVENTIWMNGTIKLSVDGLSVGTYRFMLYVTDYYGNSVFNLVIVTVTEGDFLNLPPIVIYAIVGVSIGVFTIFLYRRIQSRRFGKALDELDKSFQQQEKTGEGKLDG